MNSEFIARGVPVFTRLILFALAFMAPVAAVAKPPLAPKSKPPAHVEQLLAQPPIGWTRVYEVNTGDTRVTDYVPKGQSRKHWTSKISFESYTKLLDSDPLIVIGSQIKFEKRHCSFERDYNLFSGLENNYETAMKLIVCGKRRDQGKGEITLFKAIKGEQYFYVIHMIQRLPPFELGKSGYSRKALAAWSHYFSKIRVCMPGSSKHPCPHAAKH